jgi:hypothetical protein
LDKKQKKNASYILVAYIDNFFNESLSSNINSEENSDQDIITQRYINKSSSGIITEEKF